MDLRRWWVLLNCVWERECVRGNSTIWDDDEDGYEIQSIMNRSNNRGEAICLGAFKWGRNRVSKNRENTGFYKFCCEESDDASRNRK